MREAKSITIVSSRKKIVLSISTILYVLMVGRKAEIHVSGGKVYETRTPLSELAEALGEGFIQIHRSCLVSAMAIHDITDKIDLNSGETLDYTKRRKHEIICQLRSKQQSIIHAFGRDGIPTTKAEYRKHYSSFDNLPFAFTDIEMVFNEKRQAVDWIFRYGNDALAKLEKIPLDRLIGSSFGSLFSNMDPKWLCIYERATLYGETLEIMDFSPEIDTYLKIVCFPTFRGHCGCMLFELSEISFSKTSSGTEKALALYYEKLASKNAESETIYGSQSSNKKRRSKQSDQPFSST